MSMIGNALLNEIVKEKKITEPSLILAMLNDGIKASLKQDKSEHGASDGMDIALCCFDRKISKLTYAGAMRPLYILRDKEILEHKATKLSIGGRSVKEVSFSSEDLSLTEGDIVYVFTDGYPDQFGGPTGKKLMTKNFKKLLLSICGLPLLAQRERLNGFFNEWKGEREQIDDVLVIGMKV